MHNLDPSHPSLPIRIVRKFLYSNLSILLLVISVGVGAVALLVTPREEEPQIVVPLADVIVNVPGRSAAEVEQLISTRLEKLLYQIDGVEYVYSMSRPGQSIVTVRYYVGEDRERSLIKLYNKLQQNADLIPPSVGSWIVKPIEIDDVPIVTMALTSPSADDADLRRVAEELVDRLQSVPDTAVTSIVGGRPRELRVDLKPGALSAYNVPISQIAERLRAANVARIAGDFSRSDQQYTIEAGTLFRTAKELQGAVVGVSQDRPIYLRDVATVTDGPGDVTSYVRFGTGPAWGRVRGHGEDLPAGAVVDSGTKARRHEGTKGGTGEEGDSAEPDQSKIQNPNSKIAPPQSAIRNSQSHPSVTIAIAKKKGTNAVWVARDVLGKVAELRSIVPDNMQLVVTRNMGVTANHKVNELVEALAVAILIVIALLTVALGWREAFVVAVAVPIVFALTLLVNLLFGYTINRVTLFALILALGLLVDDPIVDVENIHRHFHKEGRSTRPIVLEAVNEVRPPLIAATLAVILSFLPMFFITGMMGPYMRPMALNVPVTMIMSMVVSFTITPWLAYHMLKRKARRHEGTEARGEEHADDIKQSLTYRIFRPLMAPLLRPWAAWGFLLLIGLLLAATAAMPMFRQVPLKMLPFDNKNELQLVIDMPESASLERTDAAVRAFEHYLRTVPEVVAFESYAGVASPMDFNGLVRHYYLRQGKNQGELRIILADKKDRAQQSHAIGLRIRDDLTKIAREQGEKLGAPLGVRLKLVESPPGPPVISTIVAEVYGQPSQTHDELRQGATIIADRLRKEAGVVDVDSTVEAEQAKWIFVPDRTKARLSGVSDEELATTLATALGGQAVSTAAAPQDRNALPIVLRLPEADRSSIEDLGRLPVRSSTGQPVQLAELGRFERSTVEQTIYHKNLRPVQYVFAECAGRAPAEAILDVEADRREEYGGVGVWAYGGGDAGTGTEARRHEGTKGGAGEEGDHAEPDQSKIQNPKSPTDRTFFHNGANIPWSLPPGLTATFSGEGEWKITLDVFRDLGLAFAAALLAIYILLVHETGSFLLPVVIMLAIPLTILGIMPGFWLLNHLGVRTVGPYADPVFFTATGMIGMIALAGIVTRDAIILVDFIRHSLAKGRSLFDAIMESRVVRLRPILLTAGAAMLGAWPITLDPIFSGLAWALIFGLFASTLFTLFVIPVAYWLLYRNVPGHGLPQTSPEDEPAAHEPSAALLAEHIAVSAAPIQADQVMSPGATEVLGWVVPAHAAPSTRRPDPPPASPATPAPLPPQVAIAPGPRLAITPAGIPGTMNLHDRTNGHATPPVSETQAEQKV